MKRTSACKTIRRFPSIWRFTQFYAQSAAEFVRNTNPLNRKAMRPGRWAGEVQEAQRAGRGFGRFREVTAASCIERVD